jgi:hypothetical protein
VQRASKGKLVYPKEVSKHVALQRKGAVRRKAVVRAVESATASEAVLTPPPSKEAIMWARFRAP